MQGRSNVRARLLGKAGARSGQGRGKVGAQNKVGACFAQHPCPDLAPALLRPCLNLACPNIAPTLFFAPTLPRVPDLAPALPSNLAPTLPRPCSGLASVDYQVTRETPKVYTIFILIIDIDNRLRESYEALLLTRLVLLLTRRIKDWEAWTSRGGHGLLCSTCKSMQCSWNVTVNRSSILVIITLLFIPKCWGNLKTLKTPL